MALKKLPDGSVPAPLPANEGARLEALRSYGVLDTPPEETFDNLALVAAYVCEVPIALVSLVDESRQWFKSRVGLAAPQTRRELAFCAHAILDDEPLIVTDALGDERFKDNPLVVGDPEIRFYAGVPLRNADGHALGTLCAIDRKARDITPAQQTALKAIAREVMTQLELRRELALLERAVAGARLAIEGGSLTNMRSILADAEESTQRVRQMLTMPATATPEDKLRAALDKLRALQSRKGSGG